MWCGPQRPPAEGSDLTLFDTLFGGRSWRTSEQVIITDVTRMEGDRVCIAGLNGRNSIRLHQPPPREQWLRSIGGLTPGDAVSLSWKSPRRYTRPHLEDADWNPALFTRVSRLSDDELVRRTASQAVNTA